MPFYLGPAGGLVQLPEPLQNIEMPRMRLGGTHETLGGRLVRDTVGYRRTLTLGWRGLTYDELSTLEALYERPGPYRFIHPARRNLLTANQSTSSDVLLDTTGLLARFQGTATSDTTQFRSGTRSVKWDTVTALGAANRGIYCYTSSTAPDGTWAAVLPSTQYTASVYLRASATVSMYAAIDFMDAAGVFISTSFGSSANPGTANFNSRFTVTATSPGNAAYAVPAALNQATTGAAVQVWDDEWMLEQAAAASAWVMGTGTPLVTIDALATTAVFQPFYDAQMTLQEIG